MTVTIKIEDPFNNEVFSESKDVVNTLPGATVVVSSAWNTGLNSPGDYAASITANIGGKVVSSSALFKIAPATLISGNIKATPSAVIYGNQFIVDYSVANSGNLDATGLALRVLVADPDTQAVMKSFDETVELARNSSISHKVTFSTQGLGLQNYIIMLQDVSRGSAANISSTAITVINAAPPTLSIISPVSGRCYNSQFDLAVVAKDNLSGIETVQYQIGGGPWISLPVADHHKLQGEE
jgi:hypothetical protein